MGTSSCDINYMEIEHMHMSYKLTTEDKVILLLFLKVFVNNPSLNTLKIIKGGGIWLWKYNLQYTINN